MEFVEEIENRPYEYMVYVQSRFCPGEWDTETSLGSWDKNGSPNIDQTTRKKENLPNCGPCSLDWPQSKIEKKWKDG